MTLELRQSIHNNILPEWMKMEEYLNGNPRRMFSRVRMTPNVFRELCTCLKEHNLVENMRGLAVEEQVLIFLSIMAQSRNNCAVQDDFQAR